MSQREGFQSLSAFLGVAVVAVALALLPVGFYLGKSIPFAPVYIAALTVILAIAIMAVERFQKTHQSFSGGIKWLPISFIIGGATTLAALIGAAYS